MNFFQNPLDKLKNLLKTIKTEEDCEKLILIKSTEYKNGIESFFVTHKTYSENEDEYQALLIPHLREVLSWKYQKFPNTAQLNSGPENNENVKNLNLLLNVLAKSFKKMHLIGEIVKFNRAPIKYAVKVIKTFSQIFSKEHEAKEKWEFFNDEFYKYYLPIIQTTITILITIIREISQKIETVLGGNPSILFTFHRKINTEAKMASLYIYLSVFGIISPDKFKTKIAGQINKTEKTIDNIKGFCDNLNKMSENDVILLMIENVIINGDLEGKDEKVYLKTDDMKKSLINLKLDSLITNETLDYLKTCKYKHLLYSDDLKVLNKLKAKYSSFTTDFGTRIDKEYIKEVKKMAGAAKISSEMNVEDYKFINKFSNEDFEKNISRKYQISNVNLVIHEYLFNNDSIYDMARTGYNYDIKSFKKVLEQDFSSNTNNPRIPITLQLCNDAVYNLFILFKNKAFDTELFPDDFATYRASTRYSRKIKRFGVLINNVPYPEHFITGNSSSSIENVDFISNLKKTVTEESFINKENFALDVSSSTYISKKLYNFSDTDLYLLADDCDFTMSFVHDYTKEILGKCLYTLNFSDVKNKVMIDTGLKFIEIYLDTLENKKIVNDNWGQYYVSVFIDFNKKISINGDGTVTIKY